MTNETKNLKIVNHSVNRVDGLGLSCGTAEYVDDIDLRGLLIGKILWSPKAHARIKSIDASKARALPGVRAVLTHHDVPRVPHTTAGQGYPEPSPYDTVVLDNKVRFVGDRVAAVAADSREIAEEALRLIEVEYEDLPPVFDPLEAMNDGAPVIHDQEDALRIPDAKHNIAARFEFGYNENEWFSEADQVFERTYTTQYAQHCAIEPHVTITYFDGQGRLIIRTSTQVPFHCRRIVAQALNIPLKKIRVIKPRIGGGFGSKQEITLEDICSALTLATKKPVKIEYTRKETFVSSRTRHPSVIRLKTGVTKDGRITDAEMEAVMNTGAYGSHALTVMMCSGSHTLPMYKMKNVKFDGKSVYTNLPVGGAYRGYGATQGFFAWEQQVDEMAEAIGMDPIEFRKKNYIRLGETSPVFKAMGEGREGVEQSITSSGLFEAIERGVQEIDWYKKWRKGRMTPGPVKTGVGCACLMQGSGIAEVDMGAASIKLNEDGSFNLLIGATDLGTGCDTVMAQIASEVLGVDPMDIIVTASDTDVTPFDVGAYASSTTYISGHAVKKAAEKIRQQILEEAGKRILEEPADNLELRDKKVVSKKTGASCSLADVCNNTLYYHNQFQVMATASHFSHTSPPPFAAHFVEISVDTETGLVKVLKYVAAVDCGTAINPRLAEGQTEGAVLNGISYALTEDMVFAKNGRMLNPSFRKYKLYNTRDVPEIKAILIPTFEPSGPFGAKSVSEISINGAQAAIANAIYDAVGVRLREAPFTSERVLTAIRAAEKEKEKTLR
jgi:putative selenate reductase molybdopterin-binding subunit